MTRNVLRMPKGFLGGLPGPLLWKLLQTIVLAKLKSTFRKRVSRVSCSSCPAWGHLLSLDVYSKIRDPNSNINVRNFGTNQRALRMLKLIFTFTDPSTAPKVRFNIYFLSDFTQKQYPQVNAYDKKLDCLEA